MDMIERFLDSEGRIKIWPTKKDKKLEILKYLSIKFEYDKIYSEKEVNAIINTWHTFNDYFLLRRGMVECRLLSRTRNGAKYWREREEVINEDS